tara:strand:- start:2148 stop:3062 length:915 start_codon:yes stop_codon:yes gene_type:complete
MPNSSQKGMNLWEAARVIGVPFSRRVLPETRMIQGEELCFSYLNWGEDTPIPMLLLHGRSQTAHSWDFVGLSFANEYRIIALDQRGHGDSDWSSSADYSMGAFQRDLEDILGKLNLNKVILVGLSMGGRNAWMFASKHPELVKALIIVDSGPEVMETGVKRIRQFIDLPDQVPTYEEFVERVHNFNPRRDIEQIRGSLQHNIRQTDEGAWTWKYDKVFRQGASSLDGWSEVELWEALPLITCPTLVIRGGRSDILSEQTTKKMVDIIPNCESITIEGAGHLVPGDKPVESINAIREFLRSCDSS